MSQSTACQRRPQRRQQFLRHQRDLCAAVAQIVVEFVGGAHRIGRYHHRAAAHDRMEGDDELRAVLAHQQHALARPHAAMAMQMAGQRLGLVAQLGVRQLAAAEDDRRLVGIALGLHRQVVAQRDARYANAMRQAARPAAEPRVRRLARWRCCRRHCCGRHYYRRHCVGCHACWSPVVDPAVAPRRRAPIARCADGTMRRRLSPPSPAPRFPSSPRWHRHRFDPRARRCTSARSGIRSYSRSRHAAAGIRR